MSTEDNELKEYIKHVPDLLLKSLTKQLTLHYFNNILSSNSLLTSSNLEVNDSVSSNLSSISESIHVVDASDHELVLSDQDSYEEHYGCILFLDASGFTKLSTLIASEKLMIIIKSFFSSIMFVINKFQGDIIKFAGDALVCFFPLNENEERRSLIARAFQCCAEILNTCDNFTFTFSIDNDNASLSSISIGQSFQYDSRPIDHKIKSVLRAKLSLNIGNSTFYQIGSEKRFEYVMAGDCVNNNYRLNEIANPGQLVISEEVSEVVFTELNDDFIDENNVEWVEEGFSLHTKLEVCNTPVEIKQVDRVEMFKLNAHKIFDEFNLQRLPNQVLFQNFYSRYLQPYIVARLRHFVHDMRRNVALIDDIDSSELRTVVTLFFLFEDSKEYIDNYCLSIDGERDERSFTHFQFLQTCFRVMNSNLVRCGGQTRQLINDDKGIVGIGTFGLKMTNSPMMMISNPLLLKH